MSTQVLMYDSTDISDYIETWQESANARLNAVTVPNRHGALLSSAVVQDARQITLTGRIVSPDGTATGLRTVIENLSELFARQNKRLQMWDDRYINCYKANFSFAYVPGSALRALDFTITFLCIDPFYYDTSSGSTSYNLTTGDTAIDITNNIYNKAVTLNYTGKFITYPIWTVTAGATALTHITIRNLTIGRQFYYSGTVLATKSLVVDTNYFTVTNDGTNDLTHWTGDFLWLQNGNNSLEFEGTAPATYSLTYAIRNY
jgi:hypothetical protein